MALHDNAPHRCNSFTAVASASGTTVTYAAAQSDIPCSINTASAREQEMFGQLAQPVSHVVAILSSVLTTDITRGMKLTDEGGNNYHVEGIRDGRAYGNIPAFTYVGCRQM